VTVGAIDDAVAEGAHTGTLTNAVSSADANFASLTVPDVTAHITDNDAAGVSIIETGGTNVAEGGATDTYDIVLNSQPTANVTINTISDAQVNTAPASVTFTPANWATPQTVTVTAVDDLVAEGPHVGIVTHTVTTTDGVYAPLPVASVTAAITDNDTAGIVVTQSGGSTDVTEGGATDTYTVKLNSKPTAAVTVTITP